jgi:putative ABC transport system ATP-binding protein
MSEHRSEASDAVAVLEDVHKSYREGERLHEVLRGVDLRVHAGELAVLFGRSGAGKSTLLNMMGGLDRPTSGTVRIAGRDISAMDERRRTLFRRVEIGFVFQAFNLIPTLTVGENVVLPLQLAGREAGARQKAERLLERVGLADRFDSFPDRLSGGEQQRIALVRALVHDPALILADEPTGNLDLDTGRMVMSLFVELVREQGRAMLVVTHDTDFVDQADRLLLMSKGKVVEADAASLAR